MEATTGNLVIDTGHTVVNNGTLEANGATLVVDDAVSGPGRVLVANGGTADFAAALDESATFSGTGTLVLSDSSTFAGEIAGISGSGDVIDLIGLSASDTAVTGAGSYNSSTGTTTLTIKDGAHTVETLTLAGNYSGSTWTVSGDGHGGIDIIDPPAAGVGGALTIRMGPVPPSPPFRALRRSLLQTMPPRPSAVRLLKL